MRAGKILSTGLTIAVLSAGLFLYTGCGASESGNTSSSDTQTEDPSGEEPAEATPEPTPDPAAALEGVVPEKPVAEKDIYPKTKISWTAVDEATGYHVFRAGKADGDYKEIGTTGKTAYVDKKAKPRKTYYYKVQAAKESDGVEALSELSEPEKIYIQPDEPKTVIVGECFALALEKVKDKFPSYYEFIARGGMTTDSIMNNNSFDYNGSSVTALEKAAMYQPDRVIFLVGANNSGHTDPKKSANNFIKMHKSMKKINPHVQFVVLAVSPWNENGTNGRRMTSHEKRHAINRAYKAVGESYDGIWYCPLTLDLEDESGNLIGKFNGGDGLHWSLYARDYMADKLQKWLKETFGTA